MGRNRLPGPKSSAYITPEGARTLRDELDYLWRTERPKVTQAVSEAAGAGRPLGKCGIHLWQEAS